MPEVVKKLICGLFSSLSASEINNTVQFAPTHSLSSHVVVSWDQCQPCAGPSEFQDMLQETKTVRQVLCITCYCGHSHLCFPLTCWYASLFPLQSLSRHCARGCVKKLWDKMERLRFFNRPALLLLCLNALQRCIKWHGFTSGTRNHNCASSFPLLSP